MTSRNFFRQIGDGMHLLRIEVENFKSFGGEMTIPSMRIYCITGPNGSESRILVTRFNLFSALVRQR